MAEAIDRMGFAITPATLSSDLVEMAIAAVEPLLVQAQGRGGVRNLLERAPALADLAIHPAVGDSLAAVLGAGFFVARAILFDKTPGANWPVAWHQDLTIAVRERRAAPGYGPWSVKNGIPHVQPPDEILETMLAVRIHLDDCGPSNGPLRVIPGSHRSGRIPAAQIEEWRRRVTAVECHIPRGGVVLMRPMLLHASSPAIEPSHRRVIHLEFSATELDGGLEWHERWRGPLAVKAEESRA